MGKKEEMGRAGVGVEIMRGIGVIYQEMFIFWELDCEGKAKSFSFAFFLPPKLKV